MLFLFQSGLHVHVELQKGAEKVLLELVAAELVVLAHICCTGVALAA